MKLFFKIMLWIILTPTILISSCNVLTRHYDYAVDTSSFDTGCSSFFEESQRYDFSTVIWTADGDCKQPINGKWWTPFYVYTTHVTVKNKIATVDINFENNTNIKPKQPITLIESSVKITISDSAGKLIPHTNYKLDKTYMGNKAEQTYLEKLPDDLIETIYFELMIGDKLVKVEKKYPLKLQNHYNAIDGMMSV